MKPPKIRNHLHAYLIAHGAFTEAEIALDALIDGKIDSVLRYPLKAGAVVLYARPFVQGNGISSFPELAELPQAILQQAHNLVMDARHKVYAHVDIQSQTKCLTKQILDDVSKVTLTIRSDGSDSWNVKGVNFSDEDLPIFRDLCKFQKGRCIAEARRLIAAAKKDRNYPPGQYTVGDNFP